MDNNKNDAQDRDSLITPAEKAMLDEAVVGDALSDDDNRLKESQLDNTDDDGDLLNEQSSADDASGNDLDIPGEEADDANEMIGEEDEENNGYSEADTE